jgi:hypothetical protein
MAPASVIFSGVTLPTCGSGTTSGGVNLSSGASPLIFVHRLTMSSALLRMAAFPMVADTESGSAPGKDVCPSEPRTLRLKALTSALTTPRPSAPSPSASSRSFLYP